VKVFCEDWRWDARKKLIAFDEQLAATSTSQTSIFPRTLVDLVLTLLLLLILVKFMQTSISLLPYLFGRIICPFGVAWASQRYSDLFHCFGETSHNGAEFVSAHVWLN
jgi:hypothetical protein